MANADSLFSSPQPPIGMAAWLISGASWTDRVKWIAEHGFDALSFLQSVAGIDGDERREVARVIRDSGLYATYHGNVHHKRTENGTIDPVFLRLVIEDVKRWLDAGVHIASVCFDPIQDDSPVGKVFRADLSADTVHSMRKHLDGADVAVGIENSFGNPGAFRSIEDFRNFRDQFSDEPPGMLFDVGHANIHVHSGGVAEDAEIGEYTKNLPLELLELHVSGNFGKADEHFEAEYGNVDLLAVFRELRKAGYRRPITVEVCVDIQNGKYGADPNDPMQTGPLLRSRDAIRRMWSIAGESDSSSESI